MPFHIIQNPKPAGDQPKAIQELVSGFRKGNKKQTLLGVTGSGKTFTMAHAIQELDKPTLVISHNKTLAAQLYEEFKHYFPKDNVKYFVSYYDFYQPEAYLPSSDTYIEKTAEINKEIEQLRHAAVNSILQHRNTIIVASVSCIYNLGSPQTFRNLSMEIKTGQQITKKELLRHLISAMQYERNEFDFWHGNIRQRDEYIDVWPPGDDIFYRIKIVGDEIREILQTIAPFGNSKPVASAVLFPAKFWISEEHMRDIAVQNMKLDLQEQMQELQSKKKLLEAERLKRRTQYDIALIKEIGWCKGIENYTRYFENRKKGTAPYTLMDYFPKDFLTIIDESHMTIPQIRGMYNGDRARKETLVEHGFRLPSALDNRPLTFDEFDEKLGQCLFASATPAEYELKASKKISEQIVRPTYLLDPEIEIRTSKGQIPDVISEIEKRVSLGERVLVTVLTKRLSEALASHLKEKKIKAAFLHSEIETLERPKILMDLRKGTYDVLVGINLLREGLDLPEVSLVAIMDADKEGFLRDARSFIQISGRTARHLHGHVIMYADKATKSMREAISETARRRSIQEAYNKKHGTAPTQIVKEISYTLDEDIDKEELEALKAAGGEYVRDYYKELKLKFELAQRNLQFEKAAQIKQQMEAIKNNKSKPRKK